MAGGERGIGSNDKILGELRKVAVAVPQMDVTVLIEERGGLMTDCATALFEEENTVVNVVTVV